MLMRIMPRLTTELEALGKQAGQEQAAAKHSVCRQAPGLQCGRVSAAGLPPRIQHSRPIGACSSMGRGQRSSHVISRPQAALEAVRDGDQPIVAIPAATTPSARPATKLSLAQLEHGPSRRCCVSPPPQISKQTALPCPTPCWRGARHHRRRRRRHSSRCLSSGGTLA